MVFGGVFRFKIFDPDGRLQFISGNVTADSDLRSLGSHNAKATQIMNGSVPFVEMMSGNGKPAYPDVYVETYVPIRQAGKLFAVAEVYVDETVSVRQLRAEFRNYGLTVGGLVLGALMVPISVLWFMAKKLRIKNAEIECQRQRAVEAEKTKSTFLAHMSHELRTPLNAIQGMSHMMVRGDLGPLNHPKYDDYAKDIKLSADILLALINDLLDLSKIEAGKYELFESNVDLADMLATTVRITQAWQAAKSKKIIIAKPTQQIFIKADQRAINQVLFNLLSNAIKFTNADGKIDIRADIDEEGNCVRRQNIWAC